MRKKIFKIVSGMLFLFLSFSVLTIHTQATEITSSADKPRVILDGFKVSEDVVIPGETFDLTFTLRNTSTAYSVSSILLTFTNEFVVPIYGQDDQIYIDTIPADETKEVTVTLAAVEKVTTVSIKFEIGVTFSDEERTNNNNLITIQLPVTKTSKFDIQNISFPEKVYVGNKTRIFVTYKNTGVDDFYNIIMNISGEEFVELQQVNLGSLVAGKVSYTEAYVDFKKIGDQIAEISFNYEDIEGNKYNTDVSEISFTALEHEVQESIETAVMNVPSNDISPNTPKVLLYVSIGAMSIVVLLLLLKYKK